MVKIIKSVNEFFEKIAPDEVGRFFFLHLPFWSLVGFIMWRIAEFFGLQLLFAFVVFIFIPLIPAVGILETYNSEFRYREHRDKVRFWQVSVVVYLAATLTLVGIPRVYSGLLMDAVKSTYFNEAYWTVISYWWRFFNFYHDYKIKDAQAFVNRFVFNYEECQELFFMSSVIVAPVLFWWLYAKGRRTEAAQEREAMREEASAKKAEEKLEADRKAMAERERIFNERLKREQEAKREEQRKLQEKINEVKGKDPWDSGFL